MEHIKPTRSDIQNAPEATRPLLRGVGNMIDNPFDDETRDLYVAAHQTYQQNPAVARMLDAFAAERAGSLPSVLANTLRTGVVWDVLAEHDGLLPPGSLGLTDWKERFELLAALHHGSFASTTDQNLPLRAGQVDLNLFHRGVATNIAERYVVFEVVAQMLGARLGRQLRALDLGSGPALGPSLLVQKEQYPLGIQEAGVVTSSLHGLRTRVFQADDILTGATNEVLSRPGVIKEYLATDALPFYNPTSGQIDPVLQLWGEASLRLQAELRNPDFMQRYRSLLVGPELGRQGLRFMWADFTQARDQERLRDEAGTYDLVTCGTMLNQLTPAQQVKELEFALSMVHDEGVVAVAELARIKSGARAFPGRDGSPFELYKQWHGAPFRYRLFVGKKDRADVRGKPAIASFEEWFWAENSRCRRIAVATGATALDGITALPEALATFS